MSLNHSSKWIRPFCMTVAMLFMAVLGIGLAVRADGLDKKTVVTFNAPVEIPGKALPAGTYVFKLLDSSSNRNIVQVWDKDEQHLLGTILAVPDYRMQPSDKPIIQFEERPAGSPMAIRAWYYPGDNHGQMFVYPHKRAAELAKANNQNVLSMSDNMSKNMATQSTTANDQSIQQLQHTDVTGVNPTGDPVALVVIIAEKPDDK
jgi:hypothetical protein